ncbi:MAG: SpoIIE family protein phosphatase [Lachnospiraceae bacterium]|nr:SpoIIE family protein phosphatase [Lachnospiraceae bacterium]
MRKKIFKIIIFSLNITLIFICVLMFLNMAGVRNKFRTFNQRKGESIKNISQEAMVQQVISYMKDITWEQAQSFDQKFEEFERDIKIIADSCGNIYEEEERYGDTKLVDYDDRDKGKIITYAAYGANVDPTESHIQKELNKISSLQGMMVALNKSNDSMKSNYIATDSGIFLCSEKITDYSLPKAGNYLRFEAKERPWYIKAVETRKPSFTGIINDADNGDFVITCGIPIFCRGSVKGVAGAGMHLDSLRKNIDYFKIGENGYSCIINELGQILFSGSVEGELSPTIDDNEDMRTCSNKELAKFIENALNGAEDINIIVIDGENYITACSPMETVGWTYLTVIPESEVLRPSEALLVALNNINKEERAFAGNAIIRAVWVMIILFAVIGIISMVISVRFADRLVAPVIKLTDKVRNLNGDKMDFEWKEDTRDEVQVLAKSFEDMTERIRKYIKEITLITAEKERIDAELSLATHIQASMLPNTFPAFESDEKFELYAKMDPAKEVGGDFYDYFYIDDDNLAIVIADVSGKGIPAALFMVIAKTLIKVNAKNNININDIFIRANEQLCEGNGENLFVTAWIGVVNLKTGLLKYVDAGHENPYVLHADGNVEMLYPSKKKLPLAAYEGTQYPVNETVMQKEDCLFLYTDGVPEATNKNNELYTTDRLFEELKIDHAKSPKMLLEAIRRDVDDFVAEAPQFDDLTMLAFKYYG